VLSTEDEAVVVAFHRHTLLPLDDCLYALQFTLPHSPAPACTAASSATASAGCRTPKVTSPTAPSSSANPIGYFHIDIAEVRAEQHSRPHRRMMANEQYRRSRDKAFQIWRQETCVQMAA
jgi:hypothetical protein